MLMKGVVVPVSTPMTPDQKIDYQGLSSLCDYLIKKGIDGLYPCGSTGEMAYLSVQERKDVLACCLKSADGRKPVFAMVGGQTTQETVDLARHAVATGASGIGVVTPYYYKLDNDELTEHFVTVAKSVPDDYAVYLYGIPQLAGNDITFDLAQRVNRLAPNVVGIKYSYPNMPRLSRFMDIHDGRFSVLTGPDELFYLTLCAGGDGVISGNANVIPEHFVEIYAAYQAGDLKRACAIQRKTNRIIEVLSGPNSMARYKAGLMERGVIASDTMRRPLRSLTVQERENLMETLRAMNYLDPLSE